MFAAKAKNQGQERKCSQKKKIFYQATSKKKNVKKNFASGTFWTKSMAQKTINIAANWASEQELQFSSKKTEIVLFTHKHNIT